MDTQTTTANNKEVDHFDLDYDPAGNVTAQLARVEGWSRRRRQVSTAPTGR